MVYLATTSWKRINQSEPLLRRTVLRIENGDKTTIRTHYLDEQTDENSVESVSGIKKERIFSQLYRNEKINKEDVIDLYSALIKNNIEFIENVPSFIFQDERIRNLTVETITNLKENKGRFHQSMMGRKPRIQQKIEHALYTAGNTENSIHRGDIEQAERILTKEEIENIKECIRKEGIILFDSALTIPSNITHHLAEPNNLTFGYQRAVEDK